MRRFFSACADALFPQIPRCIVCGVEKDAEAGVCPQCADALREQTAGMVQVRGYAGCAAYRYDGAAGLIVRRFKFGGRKWTAPFLADRMAAALAQALAGKKTQPPEVSDDNTTLSAHKSVISADKSTQRKVNQSKANQNKTHISERFDVICHVPLHKGRRRSRGYDQAQELAQCLAERLHIPYAAALRRVRRTKPQTRLNAARRIDNIKGAFAAVEPAHGRVLLVDDVLTTGATASECADVLMQAGADSVFVLTFAQALFNEDQAHKRQRNAAKG